MTVRNPDSPRSERGQSASTRARHALQRGIRFLREELWDAEFPPRSWPARGLAALQFAAMIGQGFVRDQLLLRASALTYFAVLSLVPLLAITISIAKAVGAATSSFTEALVGQLAAGSPDAQAQILETIRSADLGGVGGAGAGVLFVTTVLGLSNIERSFNHIWGVKKQRSVGRRFTDYLAVLVIAPLLFGTGLSAAATLKSQWVVQRLLDLPGFALAYDVGLRQAPTLLLGLGFAFLYWFLPNTQVKPVAALLGGLVAGIFVDLAQTVYIEFSVGAAKASAFFGGMAALPALFLWLYFFWAIVLFGAEVAFAYQNLDLYRRQVRGRPLTPAQRETVGLQIALEIARAFRDAAAPWTAEGLADALRVPVRNVREILAPLLDARVVAMLDSEDKADSYQLGRPADRILVTDVLAALRGEAKAGARPSDAGRSAEAIRAELREGENKAAAGRSLAEVLEGLSTPAQ